MFHDWPFWGWGFGFFPWVIIGLVIWLIVHATKRKDYYIPPPSPETPLDILKKRYAKGEITKEQFEQMKKDLE